MANDLKKVAGWAEKMAERKPPSAALTLTGKHALSVALSGEWDVFLKGAGNIPVADELASQLAALGSHGQRIDAKATNFALGFVDAMQPKDSAETLLLAQMAATHQAVMMMARRLNHVESIAQQDSAERALNKLARTYAGQMDTLKRYRSKGQQVVRVERVTVESGGQAIVGTVATGKRGEG